MVAGTIGAIHLLFESNTSRQDMVFEADTTSMTGIRLLLIFMGPKWKHCPGSVHTSVGVDPTRSPLLRRSRNRHERTNVDSWRCCRRDSFCVDTAVGRGDRQVCTVNWRTFRKWNDSCVVLEHHCDHQQSGEPPAFGGQVKVIPRNGRDDVNSFVHPLRVER